MFSRGFLVFRFLAALLVIALLIGAGAALYRFGFSQGYAFGVADTGTETPRFAPGYPLYPGWIGPRFGFFPFFPLVGLFLFGLLLLSLLRPRSWGYPPAGSYPGFHPGHGYWHSHEHSHPHGPHSEAGASPSAKVQQSGGPESEAGPRSSES